MSQQPKILTEDQFRLFLSDKTVDEFLRQPSDLDVDINATPPPDPKLVRARKKLRLFILDIEREILLHFTEPLRSATNSLGRFDAFIPTVGSVRLVGYREVTQQQAQSTPGDPLYAELPKLPDGTPYEKGDPNPITSEEDVIQALRFTIADVADHEIKRPDRSIEVKSEGQSREEYILTERPMALFRRLRQFDVREPHHFL